MRLSHWLSHFWYICVSISAYATVRLSLSNIKLCSITLRLSDPYCQTLNVRFHNGSFRYDSFQSGSLVSVIIMTGFRQHLNWTTKMCDHVIRLSNSGWTVQTLIRSHVRSSLIQALFWLWKIYSSCWDNDVTRNVCLNVFERVCILNEDEIQITSSSRHQEIAKIASHKSKRLHVQPKLDKCHRQSLCSIKQV